MPLALYSAFLTYSKEGQKTTEKKKSVVAWGGGGAERGDKRKKKKRAGVVFGVTQQENVASRGDE